MGSRFYSKRLRVILSRVRKTRPRPKSFSSEEAAKKWAESQKISKYTLKNLKHHPDKKKIIVVSQ